MRFYLQSLDLALKTANPELLRKLSSESCTSCSVWISRAEELKTAGRHLNGDLYSIGLVAATSIKDNVGTVLVYGRQPGTVVVDALGQNVETVPTVDKANFVFTLGYADGWRVRLWQNQG